MRLDADDAPLPFPLDPVGLDANALDRDGRRDAAVDRFLALVASRRVDCRIGHGVAAEMRAAKPGASIEAMLAIAETAARAPPLTAARHIARIRVRAIVCGNARAGRHDADAAHLSEAAEAGCRSFITHDGRLLRKRADLETVAVPGLRIVALEEFLALFDSSQT